MINDKRVKHNQQPTLKHYTVKTTYKWQGNLDVHKISPEANFD